MRIGYLTGEFPRATDVWIQREVAGLRSGGFKVQTFAVRRTDATHMVGPEQKAARDKTVYLLEQARSPRLVLAHLRLFLRSPARYVEGIKLAAATRRLGLRGSVYQAIYFIEAGLLADLLRRRKIDHLHNHFGDSSCTVAMLGSQLSGVPYSFTLHGSAIFFEAHTWRLDEKLARARFVCCVSNFCRAQAAIFAPDHVDRFHVIHCGIEPKRLTRKEHTGTGVRMIFVGRIIRAKGIEVLLETMERLRTDHPELSLTIVGDGPDRERMEKVVADRGLGQAVQFTGSQSQDEVARNLTAADIFVLPSFAEGVPVVLMEAMGAELPVIATYVGGMTELVDDEVNGLLVRPFDTEQLTDAVRRLVEDPELRQRLGRAGRRTVLEHFTSEVEAARLGSLFRRSARGLASTARPEPTARD
jgi:glycosyltransferase involved in cell wall biosynthesis